MGKYGINVPKGVAVSSVEEVRKAIETTFPNEKELVVKSQILAGGRGLGKFTSGLQGGVHIVKIDQFEEIAGKMLGVGDAIFKHGVVMLLSDMARRTPLYRDAYVYFSTSVPKELVNYIKKEPSLKSRLRAMKEMNLEYFAIDSQ